MSSTIYRPTIVRTGRGLTIGGTRLTLYMIMDFLKAGYSPDEVRDEFRLTFKQIDDVMEYLEAHRDEVESEYQQVVGLAESNRRYWEDRNRELFEQIDRTPPKPERLKIWRKLQLWKKQLSQQESLF